MLSRGSAPFFFAASSFFLSFVLLGHVLLLSLLAALIYEIYSVEMHSAMSDTRANPLALLFPATLDDADDDTPDSQRSAAPAMLVLSSAVRKIFSKFDLDGSGAISTSELRALLVDLGDERAESDEYVHQIVEQLDADGSGEVELVEFARWWQTYGLRMSPD